MLEETKKSQGQGQKENFFKLKEGKQVFSRQVGHRPAVFNPGEMS